MTLVPSAGDERNLAPLAATADVDGAEVKDEDVLDAAEPNARAGLDQHVGTVAAVGARVTRLEELVPACVTVR